MAIETLEDWNAVLACCCAMPGCPAPTRECESKTGEATFNGFHQLQELAGGDDEKLPFLYENHANGNTTRYWGRSTGFVSGAGTAPFSGETKAIGIYDLTSGTGIDGWVGTEDVTHTSNTWDDNLEECSSTTGENSGGATLYDVFSVDYTEDPTESCTPTRYETGTYGTSTGGTEEFLQGCPGPFPEVAQSPSWSYEKTELDWSVVSDPKSEADLQAEALADTPEEWTPEGCEASFVSSWPVKEGVTSLNLGSWPDCGANPSSLAASASIVASRFRWIIPDTFAGSYFKITWDILTEPDGWDAETPTVFRSLAAGGTWEWTGPGDPGDAASWKSGWYEIAPPTTPGTKRVVNIRFECYRSTKFGNKPQVTGEGVELPPP